MRRLFAAGALMLVGVGCAFEWDPLDPRLDPALASSVRKPDDLAKMSMLATNDSDAEAEWGLETADGQEMTHRQEARLGCADMTAVREAAIAGLGVALLPWHVCLRALEAGQLARVLPEWRGQKGIVHLVFTTRRGLPPAVRALIDHLAAKFPDDLL